MDEVTQERVIFALTRAIGPRLRLFSPATLAVKLEDLCLREAAARCGIPRDVLTCRPPALLRKRPGLIPAYHSVVEGLLASIALPELNPPAWWAEVNRGAWSGGAPSGSAAGGAGGSGEGAASAEVFDNQKSATAASFFEHYRPLGESWASFAERSGGMAKYRAKRAREGAGGVEGGGGGSASEGGGGSGSGGGAHNFDFPTPALPHTLDEYLAVYCGTGPLGATVARSALTNLRVGKGIEAEALLPSLPALRAAAAEHAASEAEASGRSAAAAAAAAAGRGRGGHPGRGAPRRGSAAKRGRY